MKPVLDTPLALLNCTVESDLNGSARYRRNPAGHSEQVVNLHHRAALESAPYHASLRGAGAVFQDSAIDYVEQYLAEMQPRNPAERMLAVQMLWQHARIARFMHAEASESRFMHMETLGKLIDSAMAVYRRQTTTWAELRAPRPVQIIKGQQVNMAEQQVITQAGGSRTANDAISSNKQGCTDERATRPALPAQPVWSGFAAARQQEREAVAVEHRAENAGR